MAAAEGEAQKADTVTAADSYECWLWFLQGWGEGSLRVSLPAAWRTMITSPTVTPPPMVIVLVTESTVMVESGEMSTIMAARTLLSEVSQPWRPLAASRV